MCRSGGRGPTPARQLRDAGFTQVRNLAGGISRWTDEVDPGLPKY
jgi:sulfur-carrier protein adenylyltransferase/sulfurtransferase